MTQLFSTVFATALSALVALPLAAQDRAAPILDMLADMPAAPFERERYMLEYGDTRIAQPYYTDPRYAPVAASFAFARGAPDGIRERTMMQIDDMEALVGFAHADVRRILQVADLPVQVLLMDMNSGVVAGIPEALMSSGYVAETRDGMPIYARGDDFNIDIRARNTADPFGGQLGMASRVALRGDRLFQTPDWAGIEAALAGQDTLAADPRLAGVIGTLDARPADLLGADLVKVDVMVGSADRSVGSDYVLIADMITPTHNVAVLAFEVADEATAQRVVETVTENWSIPLRVGQGGVLADILGVKPNLLIVNDAGWHVRLVVARERTSDDDVALSRAVRTMTNVVMNGGLPELTGLTP